jgi:UDP-N-acetylglucosamine acyltransferase
MSGRIHPTAIIAEGARIAPTVEIGPYCIIGGNVELADDVVLASHVCISGVTSIGARTKIGPFSSLGSAPQSSRYKGEPTRLVIGEDNDIREYVTMNTGTVGDNGVTIVGNGNLFMLGAHLAHDCVVGNGITFSNNVTLAGHCKVGDRAIFGGLAGCHQFIRIGEGAMIGGVVGVREDVIPFGVVDRDGKLGGINTIGLRRRGASRADLHAVRETVQDLFLGAGSFEARRQALAANRPENPIAAMIADFVAEGGKRPLLKFARGVTAANMDAA